MLEITVQAQELFDEKTQEFTYIKKQTLRLEHSLISLSKWESKWHKSFIEKRDPSLEETLDYFRCMVVSPQNVDPAVFQALTAEQIKQIQDYIGDPMTATTFRNSTTRGGAGSERITSELIYYWMIQAQIPFECQRWHLNRLLTLIRVCNVKNTPQKKMSRNSILSQNSALNAARRNRLHSRG